MNIRSLILLFLVSLSLAVKAQYVTGATSVSIGDTQTYTFTRNQVYLSIGWQTANGTVTSTWSSGYNYYATVRWTTPGSTKLNVINYNGGATIGSLAVTVNVGVPVSTFDFIRKCGSTDVVRVAQPPAGVNWYWQTTSTGTSMTLGSAATINRTTTAALFLRARWGTAGAWSSASLSAPAFTIVATPPAVPSTSTDGHRISNAATAVPVAVGVVSGATSYGWYTQSSGGVALANTSASWSPVISVTTDWWVESVIGSCPSTTRRKVSGWIWPEPALSLSNNGVISIGNPVVVSATNLTYDSYAWLDASRQDAVVGTAATFTANQPGSFKLRVTKATAPAFTTAQVAITDAVFSQNLNFITETTVLQEGVLNSADLSSLSGSQRKLDVSYSDGLGRVIQEVEASASPTGKDIVVPVRYDQAGRVDRHYLPIPTSESGGAFKAAFTDASGNLRSSQVNVYGDNQPWSDIRFEQSPVSRMVESGSPGISWQPDQNDQYSSTDRTIKLSETANGENEVVRWISLAPMPGKPFGSIDAGNGSGPRYHASGQLFRQARKDEEGKETIRYTDREGRLILLRHKVAEGQVPVNDDTYASTYYIYDIRGNLSCILPPEAVRQITIVSPSAWFGKSDSEKEAFLAKWASRFSYDQRRRMVADHRPGIDSTLYVYDRRDRLVMKQDGNLRLRGKWMVNKFDALNRIIITALYTPASPTGRLAVQQQLSTTVFAEKFDGSSAFHGYTNTVFPTNSLEVLSVDYFDNYDFLRLPGAGLDYVHEAVSATVGTFTYRQDTLAFKRTTGMKTGSRQLVLNGKTSPDMLRSVNWYDRNGRLAQHITDVYAGSSIVGTRRTTNVYDFTGNLLRAFTTHLPGTASPLTVDRRMTWDIAGRPLRLSQKTGAFPEVIISDRKYDEAGRLKVLQLHSSDGGLTFRQSLDHKYNVRGWLLGVNNSRLSYDSTGDYFGYNLLYEQSEAAIGNTPRFDGTPSAMRWSANLGQSAEQERAWRYSYDAMNRLREAGYLSLRGTWYGGNANRESVPARDHNGNVKTLRRYDAAGLLSDDLEIAYAGDRLQSVTDSGDRTKGFVQPPVPAAAAYSFDPNGNLIADADRGITSVTYDPFGQPAEVQMSSGLRHRIIRDASGNKLRQEVVSAAGQLTASTDYAGEFIYIDGTLTHVLHPEGRSMVQTNEYQYSIRDHVGNVRISFSSLAPVESAQAGYEPSNATAESSQYLRYANARRIYSSLFDRTNGAVAGYSQRLNGSANEKYGIARSLAVMPGDVISAEVYAKYADANQANWTGAFNTLMGQIASASAGVVVDGGQYAGSTSSFPFISLDNTAGSTGTGPKAYLNWLVFDKEYNLISSASGYARMTTLGREYGQDGPFERLASPSVKITEPGYVYIYLSNVELTPVDVFFDDFRVTQSKSPILQMDDYQPFGLTFNSATRENSLPLPYRFNGMEVSPASTAGWLWPTRYRAYDPFTGRFLQPDPIVKDHESAYAWNTGNPILFADPTGADSLQRARAVDMARRYRSMNPGDSFPLPGEQVRGLPGQSVDCSGMVSRCIIQAGEADPYRNAQGSGVRRIVMNSERIGDRDQMDRVQTGNIVTLNNTRNSRLNPNRNLSHVGIITDIRRDEEGRVVTLKMIDSGGRPGSGKSGPRESVLIENGQSRFWGQRITGFYKWDKIPDEKQGTPAKPYKFDIRKEKP